MNDQRTDEELNRIIAEWCGWKWTPHERGTRLQAPNGYIVSEHYGESWRVPNYCSDLNACHEAEGKIPAEDQMKAAVYVYSNHRPKGAMASWTMYHATARQRAEALVRVIEKEGK